MKRIAEWKFQKNTRFQDQDTAKFGETGNGSRTKKEIESEVPQSAQATIADYSPLHQHQLIHKFQE